MSGPRPRPEVLRVQPYVGGEDKTPGVNRVVKLSSNEGAFGPPPAARDALALVAAQMHRYPDGGCTELRRAIGARFGLDPARIVCGAGSDELISLLCQSYAGPGTEGDVELDWVCGGCLAVRRETFLALGGFDEDFYVYNEDMALGRASRERGLHHRLRSDVRIHGSNGG